jgi:hypothetical protein
MKQFFSFIVFIVLLLLSTPARAQDVRDMIYVGYETAIALEGTGMEILHAEFDQLSLSDDTRPAFRTLYYGQTYRIGAFGDDHISDIDIIVYKETGDTWIEIARDNKAEPLAFVEITPYTTTNYRIDVKAYSFEKNSVWGYYGLIICSNTGASNTLISDHLSSTYQGINDDVILSNYTVLRAEFDIISVTSNNTKSCYRELKPGISYTAVSVGGIYTEDIDLKIFSAYNDDQWDECCADNKSDNFAIVEIPEYSGGTYRFDTQVYKFIPGYTADVYSFLLFSTK